ncbi:coiled-coil domain-containing protein 191 isoform X2 [Emydura macquarii macquarii]|uniref:coiled-coil domain-containing protein 191 isoform X2 n=1 Tax=Emydura macquarii macquarii TaxID=1129001 RepID=UPI00352B4981
MAFSAPRPQLYRWQRLTARPKSKFNSDNVEHWIKRVEQASEFAVSEAFSVKKSTYPQRSRGPVVDLETIEQLQDHDEAYAEAQELLNDWMNSKLRAELESDQEENVGDSAAVSTPAEEAPAGFLKYDRFDDLCGYLEQEVESTTVQDFLQHLLQNEVVDCGILKDLKVEEIKEKKKTKDPRITMELRHKQCLRQHFFFWYKLILDNRIKMGKARALADWKCQLKALRAWRDYTWAQKLKQETQQLETHLRDQNRKKQLAIEHNRRQLLRCCFIAWQLWSRAEAEKRELQFKQEETRKKMTQLLEAASLGKLGTDRSWDVSRTRVRKMTQDQLVRQEEVTEIPLLWEEPISCEEPCCCGVAQTPSLRLCKKPKYAWQVTLQHAAGNSQDYVESSNQTVGPVQWFGAPGKKVAPAFGGHFEHRHAFQQQLIEEQRRQLLEQREVILELQENQRLRRAKQEVEQATAVTVALNNPIPKTKESMPKRGDQSNCKNVSSLSSPGPLGPESTKTVTESRRSSNLLTSAHPILKAMEQRAIHRAERRKELEEAKRKREEEKLVQLKAEEEERQRKEAAEKEAQLEKKREERRQQKLKELEKQKRLEREQQLLAKARDHYEKVLLRKQGLEPWKRLREQAKENMAMAQKHHSSGLQRKCLLAWLQHIQTSLAGKMARAEEFFSCLLLRRGFRSWLKYKDYFSVLEERASRLHAASLKKKLFWAWFDLLNEEKSALWEKQKIAAEHSDRRITLTMFRAWRQYPALMKEEKEKEARREQLRKRVAEILPDFRR